MRPKLVCLAAMLLLASIGAPAQYISADTYTRYELLAPETHQFRIFYEVTETNRGSRFDFNPIRRGRKPPDEEIYDLATGKQLKSEVVSGAQPKPIRPKGILTLIPITSKFTWRIPCPRAANTGCALIRLIRTQKVITLKATS